MTDKELAEEYCNNEEPFDTTESGEKLYTENDLKYAYLAGAEFGYNKANEWHKQSNDDVYDFITEDWSVKHFICIMKDNSLVTAIGNCDEGCNGVVSVNLVFDHDDEKYYLDDIVWWKEIVLPNEIK